MTRILALIFVLISSAALAQYQPPPVLKFPLPQPPIQFGVGDIRLLTNAINQLATSSAISPYSVLGNPTADTANTIAVPLSGTAPKVATVEGTLTNGHCVSIDSAQDLIDSGSSCSGGSGGVNAGLSGQIAYYATSGAVVSGQTISGDLTIAGGGVATIASNAVSFAKFAQGTSYTALANPTNATANFQAVALAGTGASLSIATASGVLTNGDCVSIDSTGDFVDAGGPCTTGGGGGTVNSGTSGQIAYYASNGTAVSGETISGDATIASGGALTVASHAITLAKMAQATSYTVLGNATNATANVTDIALAGTGASLKIATASGSLTNGHCVSIDSTGDFVDAGGSCSVGGGGGTVNSGSAGQIAYYASTGTAVSGETISGDLTIASGGAATIAANAVTVAKMAQATSYTVLGNPTGSTANVQAISLSGTAASLKVASAAGTFTNGHCASWDSTGDIVDAGAACGGGSGTVNAGTAGQLAYYVSNGTAVSGGTPNALVPPYSVTVYYNGTSWVAQEPVTGTFINTSSTTTCGVQEAITFAWQNSSGSVGGAAGSVIVYGGGIECNITGSTIAVPAGYMNSFICYSCVWNFTNTSQNGITFDTQRIITWKMYGGQILYNGNANAILVNPTTTNGPSTTMWTLGGDYDFGYVRGTGGSCNALIEMEMTVNNAGNQELSSNIANNVWRASGWHGGGFCQYNIRLVTPTGSNNAGGENWFYFTDNQDSTVADIYIGSTGGNSLDLNWGTNHYIGGIGVTGSGQYGIITDSGQDEYDLTELNNYNGTCTANVYWGPQANSNKIYTQQIIACTAVEAGTAQTFTLNNYVQGVWKTYTPTVACGSGTIGTNTPSGFALRSPVWNSKTVSFQAQLAVTAIGTCATSLKLGLPATANSSFAQIMMCVDSTDTGQLYRGYIAAGSAFMSILNYANSFNLGSTSTVVCSGTYETQ